MADFRASEILRATFSWLRSALVLEVLHGSSSNVASARPPADGKLPGASVADTLAEEPALEAVTIDRARRKFPWPRWAAPMWKSSPNG